MIDEIIKEVSKKIGIKRKFTYTIVKNKDYYAAINVNEINISGFILIITSTFYFIDFKTSLIPTLMLFLYLGYNRYYKPINIEINKELVSKFSKDAIVAIIAHEMAHLKVRVKKGENEERLCDEYVLKIGYAKNLLKFHKEHDKLGYKKYKKKDGLTRKEIKRYIESKGTSYL